MKTIVIESDENGIAKITVKEIQRMMEDAYNSGFEDGKKDATPIWYQPITVPTTTPDTTPWWYGKYDVTCGGTEIHDHGLSFSSMAKQRGD